MSPRPKRLFRLPWRSPRQIRADIDEELSFHIAERVDALIALGLSPESARAQAMREFGDIDDARHYLDAVDRDIEAARRRSDLMSDLRQDIVYAARKLAAAPLFTLTAVLTLALGIGANTAIFSVVNGVLLKPLPFPKQERIMRISFTQRGEGDASTPPDLADFRSRARLFDGFSHYEGLTANLVRDGAEPERIPGFSVSANWFSLLDVKPLYGRFFLEGEDRPEARRVMVLSEPLWRRLFGSDTSVIGRSVTINAEPTTIVGIAPAGLGYPLSAELWAPLHFDARTLSDAARGARWLNMIGRVKDGVKIEDAKGEVDRIERAMERLYPESFRERRAQAVPLQQFIVGDLRKPLLVMMAAVVLVLLIACANVANLMLVRATGRESEMAIRTALGAGRSRLVRQLMTESVLLSIVGGAAGLILARWGMTALLTMAPANLPRVKTAGIDGTTLAVTAVVAVFVGLLFGVLPAMQTGGGDLTSALRAGARGTRTRRHSNRAKRIIVISEVALAVTLLTGAGLLIRSFRELLSVDPGFKPDRILTMKLALPDRTYDTLPRQRDFARQLEQRVRAVPGVRTAALGSAVPLDNGSFVISFTIRGRPPIRESDEPSALIRSITPDYFTALGMPVRRGRAFSPEDRADAPRVAIVNTAWIKKHMSGEEPIGKIIDLGWTIDGVRQGGQIVGIVGDVREVGLDKDAYPTIYLPFDQTPRTSITIVARTAAAPGSVTSQLREAVRSVDPTLPVYSVQTMEQRVESSVETQRFYATLLGIFALVALTLAAIGLYGVIAYAVSQRSHELGVRVALGASAQRITSMVVREGLVMTMIGAGVGLVASIASARVLASLLFNVKATDPLTFAGVAATLAVVAALASWLPARRASRVDPLIAMRGD